MIIFSPINFLFIYLSLLRDFRIWNLDFGVRAFFYCSLFIPAQARIRNFLAQKKLHRSLITYNELIFFFFFLSITAADVAEGVFADQVHDIGR